MERAKEGAQLTPQNQRPPTPKQQLHEKPSVRKTLIWTLETMKYPWYLASRTKTPERNKDQHAPETKLPKKA